MPEGCSTWPAIWESGLDNYPNDGEIDILEGADGVTPNSVTAWTSAGCTIPDTSARTQTGSTDGTECDVDGGIGCAVWDPLQQSFGAPFNANGGGWFAMERTDSFIKVWFWPRDGYPPADVLNNSPSVNTDDWVS